MSNRSHRSHTRQFFFRGLAVLLPSVLTIGLLIWAYQIVASYVAEPINAGIRSAIVRFTDWPPVSQSDFDDAVEHLTQAQRDRWEVIASELRQRYQALPPRDLTQLLIDRRRAWMQDDPSVVLLAREAALAKRWNALRVGDWIVTDVIGLIVAIILIYIAGLLLGSYIGRRLYGRGEELIGRVPLIRRVYPSVKQVTDFFVGENKQNDLKFTRVVALQYPRKGIWSVGLVTGATMAQIETEAGVPCLTVFVPSSPTPFTGYVLTVPETDVLDLSVNIEDALKFAVSLGVLVPPGQLPDRWRGQAAAENPQADSAEDVVATPSAGPRANDSDPQ